MAWATSTLTETALEQAELKLIVAVNDYVDYAKKAAVGKFVQIRYGRYRDFYARINDITSDSQGLYFQVSIARKDRTGWILADSARYYKRREDLKHDIDPIMLKKLKEAYDDDPIS